LVNLLTGVAVVRWLVFDYGEVISRRTRALPDLAALLDVPPEPFAAAYWEARDAYDRGCPDLDYWRAVGRRVGVDVDAKQSAELTEADIAGWLDTDPAALELLGELDQAGLALSLLSNAPSAHGQVFRQQPWAGHFQHVVISGDLKMAKPDPEIWRALVQRLSTEPVECFFLDDRQVNIDGARAAGLQAERWAGVAAARNHLAELGVL
jgi:putative hydrolase of the HAD superfamily